MCGHAGTLVWHSWLESSEDVYMEHIYAQLDIISVVYSN